ncbi:MAG: hypothetical protein D6741_17225, partial [Planctomycetota bacterium]
MNKRRQRPPGETIADVACRSERHAGKSIGDMWTRTMGPVDTEPRSVCRARPPIGSFRLASARAEGDVRTRSFGVRSVDSPGSTIDAVDTHRSIEALPQVAMRNRYEFAEPLPAPLGLF